MNEDTNIIGSVYSAKGALVRQVPPAEDPAESAAKERQYDRGTGRRSATIAPPEHQPREAGLDSRDYDPSLKDSWAELWWLLKKCCRTYRPDASD